MSELITIHIGQAGIEFAGSCFELLCLEHGIQPDGLQQPGEGEADLKFNSSIQSFFSETKTPNKYQARSICLDVEPPAVDQIRTGSHRGIYDPHALLSDKEDSSHNFVRAYRNIGTKVTDLCLDQIRKQVEECSDFGGFIIFNGMGGGAGSGLCSSLLYSLGRDYSKSTKMVCPIYPFHKLPTPIVEPYNTVFGTHFLIDYADTVVLFDNEALYDICRDKLGVQTPNYKDINQLGAHVFSSLTSSVRYGGKLNRTLQEIQSNLVPYPRVKFLVSSYAPICSTAKTTAQPSFNEITQSLFEPGNALVKGDLNKGKFMACNLLYRGEGNTNELLASVSQLQQEKRVKFAELCTGSAEIKADHIKAKTSFFPDDSLCEGKITGCMLANSTSISDFFSKIEKRFDTLVSKKAFLHWFWVEGMDEGLFYESRENLRSLQADYKELEEAK